MRKRASITIHPVGIAPLSDASNLVRTSDCHGRLMAKTGTIKQGNKETVAFDRRFVEGFVFDKGRLERIDFPGGYFDADGEPHYLLTDRLGSVVLAVSADNEVEARYGYYPYGEQWRNTAGQQRRLASKERETLAVPGDYDFGPRTYRPGLTLWDNADRYASKFPWLSPFSYCGANPVKFIDPSGDILVVPTKLGRYTWRLMNGTWGLFNGDGLPPAKDDWFAWSVQAALNEIWNTAFGKTFLSEIINDERVAQITNFYTHPFYKTGKITSSMGGKNGVIWDYKGSYIPTRKGLRKNPTAELVHELGHVYTHWYNLNNQEPWLIIPQKEGFKIIPKVEIFTTHIENKFRKAIGAPLRTCFSDGDEIYGPILQKYGDASLYFDEDENTNYEILPDGTKPYIYR